ncbi:MAG: radical SAM protein [Nannocystaceae bacterium]
MVAVGGEIDISLVSCRLSLRASAYVPLGPMYLVSALRERGFRAELLDFQLHEAKHQFDVEGLVGYFERAQAPVIGVSLFADALPLVLLAIQRYVARHGRAKLFILGGSGVNSNERAILDRFPEIDVVVRGEGEATLPAILAALRDGRAPSGPGVYARETLIQLGRGAGETAKPERVRELDHLPWPDYAAIDPSRYGRLAIVTSRGCPFNCSFCEIITMWGRTVEYRGAADVVAELAHLVEATGNHSVDFIDDTFTVHKRRVLELCAAIVDAGIDARWTCFSRADTITEEVAEAMAAAGCDTVFFGIDTGSELLWREISKRLSRAQVLDAVGATLRHTGVTASYIWGYPSESFADFVATIRLAYEVASLPRHGHRLHTQLHFLSPTRATPIFAAHGDSLRFSADVRLEIFGSSRLRDFAAEPDYDACVALIQSDPAMFAPFYFYETPQLAHKRALMDGSEAVRERLLGATVLCGDADAALDGLLEDLRGRADEGSDAGIRAMVEYVRLVSIASDRALMEHLRALAARGRDASGRAGTAQQGRGIDAA